MSTRTDWGWFDKDGKPIAIGDAHHQWTCPSREWVHDDFYEHPITGELEPVEPYPKNCPLKFVSIKVDKCIKCGNEFRYS